MKCSLGVSNFLEEISSFSHSVIFLYFFALIAEEGFLISPGHFHFTLPFIAAIRKIAHRHQYTLCLISECQSNNGENMSDTTLEEHSSHTNHCGEAFPERNNVLDSITFKTTPDENLCL